MKTASCLFIQGNKWIRRRGWRKKRWRHRRRWIQI